MYHGDKTLICPQIHPKFEEAAMCAQISSRHSWVEVLSCINLKEPWITLRIALVCYVDPILNPTP